MIRYFVQHNNVTLEVTTNLEEARELARQVSSRHPHNAAVVLILKQF